MQSFNAPLSAGTTIISATGALGVVVTPISFVVGSSTTVNIKEANDATYAASATAKDTGALADVADQAAKDSDTKATAATAAIAVINANIAAIVTRVASVAALILRLRKKLHI